MQIQEWWHGPVFQQNMQSVGVVERWGVEGRQGETKTKWSLILEGKVKSAVSNSKVGLPQQAHTTLTEQCGKGILQNNWTSNSSFYETIVICFFLYVSHLGNKKVKAINKGSICFLPLWHSEHQNSLLWNGICNPDLFLCYCKEDLYLFKMIVKGDLKLCIYNFIWHLNFSEQECPWCLLSMKAINNCTTIPLLPQLLP